MGVTVIGYIPPPRNFFDFTYVISFAFVDENLISIVASMLLTSHPQ